MPSHIHSVTRIYRIALIPSSATYPSLTSCTTRVLTTLATTFKTFEFDFTTFDWSNKPHPDDSFHIPPDELSLLRQHDAIFLDAVDTPSIQDHESIERLELSIRKALSQYVNVRLVRIFEGVKSPLEGIKKGDVNWVIVGENSNEGEDSKPEGVYRGDTEQSVAKELSDSTRARIARVARFAFETAKGRERRKLTEVTGGDAQQTNMLLQNEIFDEVAKQYTDVDTDKVLVDNMKARMESQPRSLDTIVATSLRADIIDDLTATLSGLTGIATSSSLDPTRENPSMFGPIHGFTRDIVGKGIVNPVSAFWSAAEIVRWLGEEKAADALMQALENVTAGGVKTEGLGGSASTNDVTEAVCAEIENLFRSS